MNITIHFKKLVMKNEQGMVLVVSLIMLALMTIIGMAAINTSTIETLISGVEKQAQRNFYSADAGINYAKTLLQARFLEGNRTNMATGNTPDWNFTLNGWSGWSPAVAASTYKEGDVGSYTSASVLVPQIDLGGNTSFRIYAWNNRDVGSATNDTDGLIWVRADAIDTRGFDPTKPRTSIAVLMSGTLAGEAITDYSAQEGGGAGKNYSALDSDAVDFSGGAESMKQIGWN